MLRRYDIRPRVFRKKSSGSPSSTARGYLQEEFVTVWHNLLDQPQHPDQQPERYADQQKPDRQPDRQEPERQPDQPEQFKQYGDPPSPFVISMGVREAQTRRDLAVPSSHTINKINKNDINKESALAATQEPRANSQEPIFPNNHAACYAVTDTRTSPEISLNRREPVPPAAAGRNLSPVACGLLPDVPVDPRIKGILDNPLNFYRQYPEEHQAELRRLIAEPYHWPQPADDTMPPDVIFTMPDGARIPFTVVNRPPRKPPLCLPDRHTERWPVRLNDKEKLQVAVARFYELHALDRARQADEQEKKQTVAASHRAELSSAVS